MALSKMCTLWLMAQRGESGRVKHLRSIGHPVVSQSGASVEFLGTAMDVTEHWQARTELEKAFEEIKRLKDRLQDENVALREQIDQALMFEEIVGSSPALEAVLSSVVKVAPTDSTVLLTGETGTGKELIARAIHKRSARSSQAFVAVNCAAIPDSLIASELFGHEKGAFQPVLFSDVSGVLRLQRAARFSSMKWESSPRKRRLLSCESCKRGNLNAWGAASQFERMCA